MARKHLISLRKSGFALSASVLACLFGGVPSFAQTGTGLAPSPVQNDTLAGAAETSGSQTARTLFLQAKKYHDGDGIKQDYTKAHELYLQSASLGENDARLNLGFMYFMGEGTKQDYRKAKNWYLSAARTGSREAQLNLAHMYANGLGVDKSAEQAAYWRSLGGKQETISPQKNTSAPVPSNTQTPKKTTVQPISQTPSETITTRSNSNDRPQTPNKSPEIAKQKPLQQKFDGSKVIINPAPVPKKPTPTQSVAIKPRPAKPNKTVMNKAIKNAATPSPKFNSANTLPVWISSLLALMLLGCAAFSGLWFMRQWRGLEKLRMNRVFADTFYAHHRPMLRTSYLKYPEHLKRYSHIDDRWVVTLSVLMVKFANDNASEKGGLGRQSRKILSALSESPLDARKFVFPLIPRIQPKILDDIFAVDCSKQIATTTFQFAHARKATNVVKLHGLARKLTAPIASSLHKDDMMPSKSHWSDSSPDSSS